MDQLNLKQVIKEQLRKQMEDIQRQNAYSIYFNEDSNTHLSMFDDKMQLVQQGKKIFSIDRFGLNTEREFMNEEISYGQKNWLTISENPQNDLFVPSTIVTPIPNKTPWFQRVNKIKDIFSNFQ